MSFIEVAGDLAKELENPIVQNDLELKLRLSWSKATSTWRASLPNRSATGRSAQHR